MNCLFRRCLAILALVSLYLGANTCAATQVFCVGAGDSPTLALDLKAWNDDMTGDTFDIRLEQGTYPMPGIYSMHGVGGGTLLLRGGYLPGANCTDRTLAPANTVLDGSSINESFFGIEDFGDATIEGIAFQYFTGVSFVNSGAGASGYSTTNYFQYCIFSHNAGVAFANSFNMLIRNNLFAKNLYESYSGAVQVVSAGSNAVTWFQNNTVADNDTLQLWLEPHDGGVMQLVDNIVYSTVYGSAATDIQGSPQNGSPTPTVMYTDFGTSAGSLYLGSGNTNADPLFVNPDMGDYHLQYPPSYPNVSPAINTGFNLELPEGPPAQDLDRNYRQVGSRIDMGAYESGLDDSKILVVNSQADDLSAGTLRSAITQANFNWTNGKGPQHIVFAFPSCFGANPIILSSPPLPDIVGVTNIDGYVAETAAGARMNQLTNDGTSAQEGSNALLCVQVLGSNSIPYAFHTATSASASQLTVSGLILSGFTDAAIKLEGGSNHWINGNSFAHNNVGVIVNQNAGTTLIGGFAADDAGALNVINSSNEAGVIIDSTNGNSYVVGNLIGLDANGNAAGNGTDGVAAAFYSPNNLITQNQIGSNVNAGIHISGGLGVGYMYTTVTSNAIGVTRDGRIVGNGGPGVLVDSGSSGNQIGAAPFDGYAGANTISFNTLGGVWMDSTAGVLNSVLGNAIESNGLGSLGIDLASEGPGKNGSFGSANDGQPYPTIKNALTNALNSASANWVEIFLDNTSSAYSYHPVQIDLYESASCPIPTTFGTSRSQGGGTRVAIVALSPISTLSNVTEHAWVRLPAGTLSAHSYLFATATTSNAGFGGAATAGDTSEMGDCTQIASDMIFRDDFGGGPTSILP